MDANKTLLTDGEAADLLRILPSRLGRLVKSGSIPFVLLPDGEPRFVAEDLWAWVERHKVPEEAAR